MSQDGHPARWHPGDPVLALGTSSSPILTAVAACPLLLLWLGRGWLGPLGVSPPHPTGYSGVSPPSASSPIPCQVHGLGSKWPHPGASSARPSLLGYILVRAEGSTAKEPCIGPGGGYGVRTPPEHPQSWCWAHTHVAHLRMILQELHVLAEAVLRRWQW